MSRLSPPSLLAHTTRTDRQRDNREQSARQLDRWVDLLAAQAGLTRIAMLRLLRTRSHLTMAVARLIAASEPESAPVNTDVRTGYLEAPAPTLAAFETDAPHKTRDEQSDEERARLDAQTNDVLALLKAQQQQGE